MPISTIMLLAGLMTQAVPASSAEDWDLTHSDGVAMAFVWFTEDVTVAVRCRDHALSVLIAGLETSPQKRTMRISVGDAIQESESWLAEDAGRVVFSNYPAPTARAMRAGGPLRITLVNDGVDGRAYAYDLPWSAAAIDAVLAECDTPLIDARYLRPVFPIPPRGRAWTSQPRPEFPARAGANGVESGSVGVACLVTETGRLNDCSVESETPADAGFASVALQSLRRARIDVTDVPPEGFPYIAEFSISFRLQ